MPWWKHLYCVLGKCTECGDSAGQCLTWLIWNGLCVSGDLAGAPSALCRSIFFFFFFNILCLVQSALFQGKVLVLQSHFLTAPWAVSWSYSPGGLERDDQRPDRSRHKLAVCCWGNAIFSLTTSAPTSQLCLKWQIFTIFLRKCTVDRCGSQREGSILSQELLAVSQPYGTRLLGNCKLGPGRGWKSHVETHQAKAEHSQRRSSLDSVHWHKAPDISTVMLTCIQQR